MDNFFWLLVMVLATWRITHILALPEKIAIPLHTRFLGAKPDVDMPGQFTYPDKFLSNLFVCHYCLSVWVGTAAVIVWAVFPYALLPFAVSALSVLFEERRYG